MSGVEKLGRNPDLGVVMANYVCMYVCMQGRVVGHYNLLVRFTI